MADKPPDAFLSYTRFDDQHDGGAISEFRRRLANAVRAVSGMPFKIFQDVDGIGLGEHWPAKLDRLLDEVRFFIPILTPSYFTSKACRDELQKFLHAEAERGRKDLVLPIYYIECDVLEEEELRTADPLAAVIHERQRQNWCDLRFEPFQASGPRRTLERLAREIVKARRRAMPTSPDSGATQRGPDRRREAGKAFRDIDAPWCPEMVEVPAGEFMMGFTEAERRWAVSQGAGQEWVEPEKPQHRVRIGYRLAVGRYPVTFEEFDHFASATGREPPGDTTWGRERRPVINVSWDDARAYSQWLARETGQPYRLLSEAEWEYVCRAGTTTRYWWGDDIAPQNANFGRNVGRTSEVGAYPASPWGLYDMHGNVWQWVEDGWHGNYEGAPGNGSAWTQGKNSGRILRGGAWGDYPWSIRAAYRNWLEPVDRFSSLGFRVARTLTP